METTPRCHICNTPSLWLLKKDGYNEFECPECAMVFVHPQPTETDLANLYSPKTGYQKNKITQAKTAQPIHVTYQRIIETLKKYDVTNVLDVGCSSGDFLFMATEQGVRAVGVEPNESTASAARARGLEVHLGTLDSVTLEDHSFDAVHAGDVIEHVMNPRDFVSQLSAVTKQDGYIVLVTPNINCFWAKATRALYTWFRLPWSVITPPFHLWQFSDHNLDRLLKEKQCVLVARWYNHLPNLRYELGSTHALRQFKNTKSVQSAAILVGVLLLYPLVFGVNYVTKIFRRREMGMVSVYQLRGN